MIADQLVRRKAELGDRARLEVLDEHVGLGQHRGEQCLVGGVVEIEHRGFLAAVEPDEIGAFAMHQIVVAAGEIALRPLDLDDARPRIGKPAGAHGRRDGLLEGDDKEAGKGKGHGATLGGRDFGIGGA